jgi:hypothetical protein
MGTILVFSAFSLTDMVFMRGSGATLLHYIVPVFLVLGYKAFLLVKADKYFSSVRR